MLRTGRTVRYDETVHVRAGRLVVETTIAPVRDADGRITHLLGAARDVTEQRRAEAERRALEERLQHAQKLEAVGQLAGGLAHDLNNMLFVVQGNRELVEGELETGHAARAMLAEMDAALDGARRLVRSLLTFSRRETVQPESLDVGEVVRAFVPLLQTATGERRIALDVSLPTAPVRLVADRSHVEQLLMNLVVNARDAILASPHGHDGRGGTIAVAVRVRWLEERDRVPGTAIAAGRCLELVVRDDGHGMDDATRARAFEPFFTTKPVGSGTGLGLATVFGIVQRLGGDVRIDSAPGAGTTVSILIPLGTTSSAPASSGARDATTHAPPVAALAPESGALTIRTHADAAHRAPIAAHALASDEPESPVRGSTSVVAGATVLLVEDEDAVRRVARRLLERAGARVLEATNGVEALAVWAVQRDAITLVVTDVRMPSMDGVELAHRLRADRSDLPIVFMSGYADRKPTRDGSARLGFVAKPFGASELLSALGAVLA
mgnify:CR=1 FL=1